jgi:hypothetical protein
MRRRSRGRGEEEAAAADLLCPDDARAIAVGALKVSEHSDLLARMPPAWSLPAAVFCRCCSLLAGAESAGTRARPSLPAAVVSRAFAVCFLLSPFRVSFFPLSG